VLHVNGLARDAERLRYLRPRPPRAHRALDVKGLHLVRATPKRHDGREAIGDLAEFIQFVVSHISKLP